MMLFKKRTVRTHLVDYPGHADRLWSWVAEHQRLSVGLIPGSKIWRLSKRARREIYRHVLDKIQPAAQEILIYDLNPGIAGDARYRGHLESARRRHRLHLLGKPWREFEALLYARRLQDIGRLRGGIVFVCRHQEVPWAEFLRYCFNPVVIDNESVASGASALNYARKHCDREITCLILCKTNRGLQDLSIVAEMENLRAVFDLASRECRLTGGYRATLGIC